MVTKIKKVSLIVCSAALVFAAAGCAGSADPVEPTPTASTPTAPASSSPPTTSPSPSIKPTPKPIPASSTGPAKNWPVPVMPDAAKKKTEAGIKAFTEYWFNVLEYMYVTNETKQLKAITRPQCDICAQSFIDPADGLAKNKAWSVGGKLDTTITLAILESASGVANFRLEREEILVYDKDGKYSGKLPGTSEPDIGTLVLKYEKGWQVIDLQWLDSK